jgi:protein SCO1/2
VPDVPEPKSAPAPRLTPARAALAIVVVLSCAGLGALAAHQLLRARGAEPIVQSAALYPRPRALAPFALVADDGQAFNRESLSGHWSLVFFGYTACPDLCPATLALLAQVDRRLADLPAGLKPHIVMITVDPERDDPAKLGAYVHFFEPTFKGLTGAPGAVADAAAAFGVAYRPGADSDGGYSVDHSAAVYLVDPSARLRAVFMPPQQTALLASDYRALVAAPAR